MLEWRNKKNINIFGLEKASYQKLCWSPDYCHFRVLSSGFTGITHLALVETHVISKSNMVNMVELQSSCFNNIKCCLS